MTDTEKIANAIARQVKIFVARELAPYADRLAALEIKKEITYRGTWSPDAEYSIEQREVQARNVFRLAVDF